MEVRSERFTRVQRRKENICITKKLCISKTGLVINYFYDGILILSSCWVNLIQGVPSQRSSQVFEKKKWDMKTVTKSMRKSRSLPSPRCLTFLAFFKLSEVSYFVTKCSLCQK